MSQFSDIGKIRGWMLSIYIINNFAFEISRDSKLRVTNAII